MLSTNRDTLHLLPHSVNSSSSILFASPNKPPPPPEWQSGNKNWSIKIHELHYSVDCLTVNIDTLADQYSSCSSSSTETSPHLVSCPGITLHTSSHESRTTNGWTRKRARKKSITTKTLEEYYQRKLFISCATTISTVQWLECFSAFVSLGL